MSAQLISIYALGAMFVVATLLPINMGVLAFVGAFLVGTLVAGQATKDIIAGFPAGLFLTLVGITYLFAIAQNNGTINWLVQLAVRAVRGHVAAIPWIMFALAAVLTAVGAVSPAAVAIIAPIALGFAMQHKISPLLMGLMVIHGAQAGGFSPISIYGGITNGIVAKAGPAARSGHHLPGQLLRQPGGRGYPVRPVGRPSADEPQGGIPGSASACAGRQRHGEPDPSEFMSRRPRVARRPTAMPRRNPCAKTWN